MLRLRASLLVAGLACALGCSRTVEPLDPDPIARDAAAETPDAAPDGGAASPDASTPLGDVGFFDAGPAPEGPFLPAAWMRTPESEGTVYLQSFGVHRDGEVVLVLDAAGEVGLGGRSIAIGSDPGTHLLLARLSPDGEVRELSRLLEAESGAMRLVPLADGDLLALGFTRGTYEIRPDSPEAIRGQTEDAQVFLARLDREGRPRWIRPMQGTLEVRAVLLRRDGRLLLAGHAAERLVLAGRGGPQEIAARARADYPGHGVILTLGAEGFLEAFELIDGDAGSTIASIAEGTDGTLAFAGSFGGFPNGLRAELHGGAPDQAVLTNVSSDDDPALDLFFGALGPDDRVRFFERMPSYNNGPARLEVLPRDDGEWLLSIESGSVLVLGEGEPNEQVHHRSVVARFDSDGSFSSARPGPLFGDVVHREAELMASSWLQGRDGDPSAWVVNEGEVDEIRLPLIETPDRMIDGWALAALGADGRARRALPFVTTVTPNSAVPQTRIAPWPAGNAWFLAVEASGVLELGFGSASPVVLAPDFRNRIFIVRVPGP